MPSKRLVALYKRYGRELPPVVASILVLNWMDCVVDILPESFCPRHDRKIVIRADRLGGMSVDAPYNCVLYWSHNLKLLSSNHG